MPLSGRTGRTHNAFYLTFQCFHLFDHISVTKLVNMIFWKWMNRFWCKVAQVVHGTRTWNRSQKSKLHEARVRLVCWNDPFSHVAFQFRSTIYNCVRHMTHVDAGFVPHCAVCWTERRFVEITTVFQGLHGLGNARVKYEHQYVQHLNRDATYVCNYR